MKRILSLLISYIVVMLLSGADFKQSTTTEDNSITKKHCTGFTVIESLQGVDCNGDTIKLMKLNGIYVRYDSGVAKRMVMLKEVIG